MARIVSPSNSRTTMASRFQGSILHDKGTMLDDTINTGKGPLHCSVDVVHPGADADDATPTKHKTKRGKVFPPFLPDKCRTSVIDVSPFEWRDPAAASRASLLPTADDYANLVFCSEDEEAEATSATATATKPNKRKRRRVSFGASLPTVHLLADVPPCHAMTSQEKSALWLSRSDLEDLKSSAQRSIREVRDRIKASHDKGDELRRSEFRALVVAMEDETGSSVRGLEQWVFKKKQTRQDLIRDVLECQSHIAGLARFGHKMDGEEKARLLARASQDRSLKARRVAQVDATEDFREVCGGGDNAPRILKRRKRRSEAIYES